MATKKIPFKTIQDEHERIYTPSGEKLEEVWTMKINDEGKEEFYISGKTNIYEKIQAFAEDVKIENIIAKVTATGDNSILEKVKYEYADTTELPTNLFEAQQKIKDAEEIFNQLPTNIKESYGNNFNMYLKDFGSETWAEKMGLTEPKTEPIKENTEKGEVTE